MLTWATNGFGLLLAVALVALEWVARNQSKVITAPDTINVAAR